MTSGKKKKGTIDRNRGTDRREKIRLIYNLISLNRGDIQLVRDKGLELQCGDLFFGNTGR